MERWNQIPLAFLLFSFAPSASALAQNNSASTSSTVPTEQSARAPQQTADASAEPAPKKVWTNDDMPNVSHGPTLAKPSAVKVSASKTPIAPKPKNAKPYQDQIARLQAQLPPLEDRISELQAVLSGETVEETRKYAGVRPDDWSLQLKELQQKRDDIFAKIAALEDEARHNGIPANSLP